MVLRQIPVNFYDVVQLENYLAYMAEQGLFLRKVYGFGIFQRGVGEKAKYHAEFLDGSSGSLDKEKLTPFEDAGWEYICKIDNSLYILKANSEEAKELTIEPDALKEKLIKAKKKNRNILLSLVLYFLFLSFIVYDAALFEFPVYYAIKDSGILIILIVLITTAFMLLWIFMISIFIYSRFACWEKPLEDYHGMYPGVPLAMVETKPNLRIHEYEEEVRKDFRTNNIQYRWTELAPEIYKIEEIGKIDEEYQSIGIDTEVYALRYQFLVDPFINDYMKFKKNSFYSKGIEWQDIENIKFDQAYYGHSRSYQGFFASIGNKVICVQYYGDEKVSDFSDKKLSKFSDEIYQSLIQFDNSK